MNCPNIGIGVKGHQRLGDIHRQKTFREKATQAGTLGFSPEHFDSSTMFERLGTFWCPLNCPVRQGSHLFFQIISARHQKKPTMLTTNLPFADWGKVFDSTTVATAIADRLVFRSEILILGGSSYRRKEK
jgi:hypothetical protein